MFLRSNNLILPVELGNSCEGHGELPPPVTSIIKSASLRIVENRAGAPFRAARTAVVSAPTLMVMVHADIKQKSSSAISS